MTPEERAALEAELAEIEAREKQRGTTKPTDAVLPVSVAQSPSDVQLSFNPDPSMFPGGPQGDPGKDDQILDPELEAFPDLDSMPELGGLSLARLGFTFATDADRVKKIIKSNWPGAQVETISNYMLVKSPSDGKVYAWKPGLRGSDIKRGATAAAVTAPIVALGGGLAGAVASRLAPAVVAALPTAESFLGATLGGAAQGAAGELISEAAQSAAGAGPVDPMRVAAGTVFGAGTGAGFRAAGNMLRGAQPPAPVPQLPGAPAAQSAYPTAVQAARGSDTAIQQVAGQLAPDPKAAQAAAALNLDVEKAPWLLSGDREMTPVVQGAASRIGSPVRAVQDEVLEKAARDTVTALEDLGAKSDLSGISDKVTGLMQSTWEALRKTASDKWNDIMPMEERVWAPNVLKLIKSYGRDLENYPQLAKLKKEFTHRSIRDPETGKIVRNKAPDWRLLTTRTAEIGEAAFGKDNTFRSMDQTLQAKLREAFDADRALNAARVAGPGVVEDAIASTRAKYDYQNAVSLLMGKQSGRNVISGDLFAQIAPAIEGLAKGNTAKFRALNTALQQLPQAERAGIVFSGFVSSFMKNPDMPFDFTAASKMFKKLDKMPTAKAALMSTLDPAQRQGVANVEIVANQIRNVVKQLSTTGRTKTYLDGLRSADTFMGKLVNFVNPVATAVGAAVGARKIGGWSGAIGGSTAGRLIGRALKGSVDPVEVAFDKFLVSPELPQLIKAAAAPKAAPPTAVLIQRPALKQLLDIARVPASGRQKLVESWLRPAVNIPSRMAAQSSPPTEEN